MVKFSDVADHFGASNSFDLVRNSSLLKLKMKNFLINFYGFKVYFPSAVNLILKNNCFYGGKLNTVHLKIYIIKYVYSPSRGFVPCFLHSWRYKKGKITQVIFQ